MPNYTIEKIDDVWVVSAPSGLAISDFARIAQMAGDGVFLDADLAKYLDVHTVFGSKDALSAMRLSPPPCGPATAAEISLAKKFGLSDEAQSWLCSFKRGNSSETLFSMATRMTLRSGPRADVPHDLEDFKRCVYLANMCVEVRQLIKSPTLQIQALHYLGEGCALTTWMRLFNHWDELAKMGSHAFNDFLKDNT